MTSTEEGNTDTNQWTAKERRVHEYWMREAIKEARKAEKLREVPIGAVVVYQNQIVGRGHNLRETSHNATTHAEMLAIQEANHTLDNWRLADCDLYVTLEPCPMCSGAMILSRIRHVYFGAYDQKGGTAGTLMNLLTDSRFNHQVEVTGGVLLDDTKALLQNFFKQLRAEKKAMKKAKRAIENEDKG
ncbi:tRNA adenosine(34) deaminase TadA [Aerococcus suis]|uniref:tRNA-specific adenosine deaminase n=1 Tax=Aerococcus suis TaxID=371602 RepID=A0A1W1YT60_9LACT|nr:tRNA adenosine(34) deaminase TadA [Aerococcus suis]MDY4646522.1 tRNA adenosine(34) deaminase TadA [Aerococcus suis]SMC39339.1 tRNA-adenosine deaminase [Aerococcus suis]